MRRLLLLSFVACLFVCWSAVPVLAGVSYQYVFDRANYIVAPGGTVAVNVYLEETVGSGGTSILSDAGIGMFGAGVMLRFDDSPQPTDPARVLAASDIAGNTAFDQVAADVSSVFALLAEDALLNPYVHGSLTGSTGQVYRLLIGTFTLTSGTVSGEATPIQATRYGSGVVNVDVTASGAPLDGLITAGTASVTTALAGDANLDGAVDFTDLTVLLSHYNQTIHGWNSGDFDGSGTVDFTDLTALLGDYNRVLGASGLASSAVAAVPEPSTLGLILIAFTAFLALRRRRRP